MIRARELLVFSTLAAFGCGMSPLVSHADSRGFRLHVQGHMGASASAIDIDMPWDSAKKSSPFDFTADACDGIKLDRMRSTWAALQKGPEGRTVEINTDSEKILASRSGGYLVLEPIKEDGDDHHTRVKIHDPIFRHSFALIDATLAQSIGARSRG